ncbi:MAG TPA: helix-turn-helix domain-containing protein [Actinomycetota bacterium]|nr:helix-turn-helix domain-containing protein [Actinomycetota bacterium]
MQEGERRRYDSGRRQANAAEQRRRILETARRRFLADGYAATTVAAIAGEAGVSVETVYKNFLRKPGLLKAVFDRSVAGDDEPVPMAERDFAQRMRADPDPRSKLEVFAGHMAESMPRAAPIYLLARAAAASEPDIAALLASWRTDQLHGLTGLARHLDEGGHLRRGLTVERARDLLWTINSTEVYELLVIERNWSADEYRDYLARAMIGGLLG